MESIYDKNYLLTLSLLTLLFLNSAQAYCVKKNSQSTLTRAASAPSPHSPSPSAPSPGSHSSSSSPPPTQSTPLSSSPSAPKSTPSSSSPSPTQSTSPSSSPSAPKSTPSSSSPSPTQSTSPSSSPSAPKSTPTSSSPSPTQTTPSSNPSPRESNPSSPTPSTSQSPSPSPKPSIQMQSFQFSTPSMPQSPSPSSNPSLQMQSTKASAPSTSQNPPPQSTPPLTTQPPPTMQTQAPSVTPPTMMDSPDGEVPTTSSPTGSTPSRGVFGFETSSTVVNNEAIKKICQNTDFPPLCLESISPFFNGKTDIMQVLAMAINASSAHTEVAMKFLDELANKPATPPRLASALQDCKENFEDALDNLEAAYDAIADNDIGTIQTMLSAALTDYVTCADGFPGLNPLGIHTEKLNNMASNCLAIAELHK